MRDYPAFALGALLAVSGLWVQPAEAAQPVAIVEEVEIRNAALQPMDYLSEGTTIVLGQGDKLVVSFLDSCAIESISGGPATVTIEVGGSRIQGNGRIRRRRVECGGIDIVPTRSQGDRAAGFVMRGVPLDGDRPAVTIYSLYPIFLFSQDTDRLVIENTQGAERHELKVVGRRLDTAELGLRLKPGATYRASAGDASVTIEVADTARATRRNIITRLVGL